MKHRRKEKATKGHRGVRSRTCARYLREAGSIPAAVRLAKSQGFSVSTSVWIGALGKMLNGKI